MRAILVDDEKPALLHMERLLNMEGRLTVLGKFTTVREALDYIAREKTDVVFLDIGMPEMNGLEAARYFEQADSRIRIVYVTAYSEYAIEAFELNAIDYLLKPVSPIRLAKTISRLLKYARPEAPDAAEPAAPRGEPMISVFQRMEFRGGGTKLKWRTAKAQELFAYMLHQKGKWIDKDQILELLWPDMPSDKSMTYLHTSVYQIRKLLKEWGAGASVEYAQDCYRLTAEHVLTDAELLEQELSACTAAEADKHRCSRIMSLYTGPYMYENDYAWAKARREQLHQKYMDFLLTYSQAAMEAGRPADALQPLLDAQEKDPYSEALCRMIMAAYAGLGEFRQLQSYYASFCELIGRELGVEPEPHTAEAFGRLMNASGG
ncbi:response regulator [Paenibacillus sp. N4]|uniref:response regulator n=1 Tax=Paenibacillus vietnamensis TaxID=2590547 RepID=UPI001CD110C7|nr:response regulator [Paenibacillus vietnamensis]MCA0756242.1 response regulator [Paenibacillus vietnamensis]